jgi:hypothetical protein
MVAADGGAACSLAALSQSTNYSKGLMVQHAHPESDADNTGQIVKRWHWPGAASAAVANHFCCSCQPLRKLHASAWEAAA